MLHDALDLCTGPASIRWPRTTAPMVEEHEVGHGLAARKARSGADVCLVGVGKMLAACLGAAELLAADGIEATVWDPRVIKPLDPALIDDLASFDHVITAEDGLRDGGIGASIMDAVSRRNAGTGRTTQTTVCGVPTEYVPHGDPEAILAGFGLDPQGLAATTRSALAPPT